MNSPFSGNLTAPEGLLLALLLVFNAHWLYQLVVGLPGLLPVAKLPAARSIRRFAVIVPAHNEEAVIGYVVDNVRAQQTYPQERIDVFVAADNCTDRTAAVAAAHGARVLRRSDTERTGKTWNMRWALGQVPLDDYDLVVMLDADNIVAADFFARMNDYFEAHPEAEAVQGYLDTKNPHDSWVTRAYALAYWYNNRFWQLARTRIGLSAQLGGTGCAFRVSCLRRMGWDLRSLTDDLEFYTQLVLAGGRVHWNEWAVTYDEKPATLGASGRQRLRWMRGHYWCFWHYGPRVLGRFLRTGRVQFLDTLILLATPGRNSLAYTLMLGGLVVPIARTIADPLWLASEPVAGAWLGWSAYTVVQTGLRVVIGPSLHERRLTLRYLPNMLTFLWWGLTWIPFLFLGMLKAYDQHTWTSTKHTRGLALEEVTAEQQRS